MLKVKTSCWPNRAISHHHLVCRDLTNRRVDLACEFWIVYTDFVRINSDDGAFDMFTGDG